MTPDKLRKIAVWCGYDVRDVVKFAKPALVLPDGNLFAPHLDAKQADECLNRVFGGDKFPVWTMERYRDTYTLHGFIEGRWVESEPADTFCAAAMNAILEVIHADEH